MADMASTSSSTTSSQNTKKQEPNLEPHMYRYKVKTFTIETNNDPDYKDQNYLIELNPVAIRTIKIVQDFDNDIHPIMEITVVLPPPVIDYIDVHMNEIKFILRIDMIDFISPTNDQAGGSDNDYAENGVDILCNDKFITVMPDAMKMPNLNEYRLVSDVLSATNNAKDTKNLLAAGGNVANYTMERNYFLWNEHDLYVTRKQVNVVYSSITVGDAASSMLSDNGFKKVLIAQASNNERFGQLIIPPMSMMNVFRFLQNQYGMYNTDVIFFTDIWRTYVIDRSGECTAHEDGEYTRTIFSFVSSASDYSRDTGTSELVEKKEYHVTTDIGNVATRSLSSVHDVIQGNTSMYIDSRNNEVTTVKGASEQRGEGCVNVTTDREGTSFTKKQQANAVAELGLNMKISGLKAYNYFSLSPNKSFIMNFKDKDFYQYNGYYRLMNCTHILTREGGGDQMNIMLLGMELTRKKALSEDERKTIEYDVFRTAQVTEEGKDEAKKNGEENRTEDPSYKQSESNKIDEGKKDAPKADTSAKQPGAISDVSQKPQGIPALTQKELGDLDLYAQPSKAQPFNPDTDKNYKSQENKRAETTSKEPVNKGGGMKQPTPLDQK